MTHRATKFQEKILLGKVDGQNIWLSAPSWDCGWYWGFGYLGNKDCHYHVDGLETIKTYVVEKGMFHVENVNLHDGFKKHFDQGTFIVKDDSKLWTLAELFKTFYTLRQTAEVLGRGGSHFATNPLKDTIINKDEVTRINSVVMPKIFDAIHDILTSK